MMQSYLGSVVPPVLHSLVDPDARVRYYACEALYNIAKVAREEFMPHFLDTFEALFRLCADADQAVHQATSFLDNLLKVRGLVWPAVMDWKGNPWERPMTGGKLSLSMASTQLHLFLGYSPFPRFHPTGQASVVRRCACPSPALNPSSSHQAHAPTKTSSDSTHAAHMLQAAQPPQPPAP